jgi:hypothetical protein
MTMGDLKHPSVSSPTEEIFSPAAEDSIVGPSGDRKKKPSAPRGFNEVPKRVRLKEII